MSRILYRRVVGVLAALALAVGISAASAPPAEAKRGVWDRVAACESGGRWHINTGNGYYGGLQFSSSTWRAYGGRKYGRQAHKASKGEQIAIARRVLAGQGPGAWPTCSRKAGLTRSNGKASRNATPSGNPGSSTASSTYSVSKKFKKSSNSAKKKYIRVKKGDTLGKIASRYDVKGGWKRLYKLNKSRLNSPHSLKVGQKLRIR